MQASMTNVILNVDPGIISQRDLRADGGVKPSVQKTKTALTATMSKNTLLLDDAPSLLAVG